MEKKYELLNDDVIDFGQAGIGCHVLRRIRALKDFDNVHKGDLGRYIESEYNLSHHDNCWVADSSIVCGSARISKNAQISELVKVCGKANIFGNTKVSGETSIHDNVSIFGDAEIDGMINIRGNVVIKNNAKINGYADIAGYSVIGTDAYIEKSDDILVVGSVNSVYDGVMTFYKNINGGLNVDCYYFSGSVEDFIPRATNLCRERKKIYKEYVKLAKMVILDT